MTDSTLNAQLAQLGFPLMEPSPGGLDANLALANVIISGDIRLMEGFPVILANAAKDFGYDFDKVNEHLGINDPARKLHKALVILSLALYQHYRLTLPWTRDMRKRFSADDLESLEAFGAALEKDVGIDVLGYRFDLPRIKNRFDLYFTRAAKKTRDLRDKYEELSIEYALSQVFSPKQKELFMKKLKGELLTKTEREYYSRTVKKKVAALANADVHRLAKRLMDM